MPCLASLALLLPGCEPPSGTGETARTAPQDARPAPAPAPRPAGAPGCAPGCPDVVLIVVDTLRADHLGIYGHQRDTSPHLDRWAASGRVYHRAIANSPWTLPSMASLLTGVLPGRHRAGEVPLVDGKKPGLVKSPKDLLAMVPDVATLAEHLEPLGYRRAAFVTNSFLAPGFGVARGFEHYDQQNARVVAARRADATVDRALAWLAGQARKEPVLLLVHLFDPHLGYDAPPPARGQFSEAFAGGRYELPFVGEKGLGFGLVELEERDREFIRAAYDEEIRFVDGEIERLRAGLAAGGRLQEAIVVLTSDHGEEFFEHGGFEHGHANWQPIVRVPLIVWGPGVVEGGEEGLVSLVDVVPTLLDALGLPRPARLAGRSLWPNLSRAEAIPEAPIYTEANVYGPRQRSIIDWPLKLTYIVEPDLTLLFDLAADPGEQTNIAADRPGEAASLRARMLARIAEDRRQAEAAARPTGAAVPADATEALRSLGYIE